MAVCQNSIFWHTPMFLDLKLSMMVMLMMLVVFLIMLVHLLMMFVLVFQPVLVVIIIVIIVIMTGGSADNYAAGKINPYCRRSMPHRLAITLCSLFIVFGRNHRVIIHPRA